jgi:diguanylate cyclase (GGDEF)-like protein
VLDGIEFPPLMGAEKTAEFLLVQVARVTGAGRVCLKAEGTCVAYDYGRNRFYRPSPDEMREGWWTAVPLRGGALYLKAPLEPPQAEALKKFCSRALANALEYERVLREMAADPLTGLLNRGGLCKRIKEEVARCSRRRGSFCVVFLDVDNLKGVNDTHGHLAGDKVLKGVAKVIRGSLRKSDVAGRCGGDEFVILLTDTSRDQGEFAVRRLLERVERIAVAGVPVSVSVGVACFPEDGCSPGQLIRAADRRMYEDKLSRRGERP